MVGFAEACLFSALEGEAKFWIALYICMSWCTSYNVVSYVDLARPSKQTLMCLKFCLKILEANNDPNPDDL